MNNAYAAIDDFQKSQEITFEAGEAERQIRDFNEIKGIELNEARLIGSEQLEQAEIPIFESLDEAYISYINGGEEPDQETFLSDFDAAFDKANEGVASQISNEHRPRVKEALEADLAAKKEKYRTAQEQKIQAVSYTHLTLPTILRV